MRKAFDEAKLMDRVDDAPYVYHPKAGTNVKFGTYLDLHKVYAYKKDDKGRPVGDPIGNIMWDGETGNSYGFYVHPDYRGTTVPLGLIKEAHSFASRVGAQGPTQGEQYSEDSASFIKKFNMPKEELDKAPVAPTDSFQHAEQGWQGSYYKTCHNCGGRGSVIANPEQMAEKRQRANMISLSPMERVQAMIPYVACPNCKQPTQG